MKFCSQCGQRLSDSVELCPVCGHDASDASSSQKNPYDAEKYTHGASVRYVYKKPSLTIFLIAANVLIYLVITVLQSNGADLSSLLSMHRGAVRGGQFYRVVTSIFTHEDFFHLASNCYALYIYGMLLEPSLGKGRFAAVYFVSGLLGNALSFAFMSNPSIGASGAIFGLLGAVIAIHFINPTAMSRSMATNVAFSVALTTFYSIGGNINNLAHFGGLFGGYLMTCLLTSRRVRRRVMTNRVLSAVVLTVLFAFSCAVGASVSLSESEKGYGDYTAMCFFAAADKYDAAYPYAVRLTQGQTNLYTADAYAVRVIYEYSEADPNAPRSLTSLFAVNAEVPLMNEKIYEKITEFTEVSDEY